MLTGGSDQWLKQPLESGTNISLLRSRHCRPVRCSNPELCDSTRRVATHRVWLMLEIAGHATAAGTRDLLAAVHLPTPGFAPSTPTPIADRYRPVRARTSANQFSDTATVGAADA